MISNWKRARRIGLELGIGTGLATVAGIGWSVLRTGGFAWPFVREGWFFLGVGLLGVWVVRNRGGPRRATNAPATSPAPAGRKPGAGPCVLLLGGILLGLSLGFEVVVG